MCCLYCVCVRAYVCVFVCEQSANKMLMLLLSSSLLLLPFMQKQKATNVNFEQKPHIQTYFIILICCEFRLLTNLLQKVKATFLFV